MPASATGGRVWSSPGRAATSVIPPVAGAGRCWRRTGRCVGISTFILATTRGFGRCAARPKSGARRAGVGARGGRAGERLGRPGGRSRRAADRGRPCSGPFRLRSCLLSFVGDLEAVEREIADLVEV